HSRAGVTLGEAAPAAELCAGDALEWELRPSRASTWEAPEVRLDGRAASCPSEPVGDQGVGRVRCTLGVDLPISDTLPHTLEIVHDGAVIATTVIRLGAP
ncbi:MAG TPA: hypothetical protein PKA64_19745, partial [Myxococcota bacterium]|nr:hypothetical protein [Myxococcota bacterium]